jgi:hypothetical protein
LIEKLKVAIRSRGMEQRRRKVDNLAKTQLLIVDRHVLVSQGLPVPWRFIRRAHFRRFRDE